MPGFTTHYLFGVNTYKSLRNDALKKIIFDHHAAYSLGQQGPDIFFYYLPSYVLHKNNIGSVAHIQDTGKFLSYLIESRKLFPDKREEAIAQAYPSLPLHVFIIFKFFLILQGFPCFFYIFML